MALTAVVGVLVLASAAAAQTLEQRGYRPVEQVVEDIEPLRVSLRRDIAGLSVTGERHNVFRRIDDPNGRFTLIKPGVTADYDRSQYLATSDREVLQLIPPNTVFRLDIPGGETAPPVPTTSRPEPEATRYARVNGQVAADPMSEPDAGFFQDHAGRTLRPGHFHRQLGAWDAYRINRVRQRTIVIEALLREAEQG